MYDAVTIAIFAIIYRAMHNPERTLKNIESSGNKDVPLSLRYTAVIGVIIINAI